MIRRRLLSFLFAVALAACGRDGSAKSYDASFGTPIQLAPGDSALFAADELEVRFTGIGSDSRCPTDVTCVWQGTVRVLLTIRSNRKATRHEADESNHVAVDGYTVMVLETLPARGPQNQRIAPADYRVTLKVMR